MRAHSGDVIRLADVNPVIGGEYESNGVTRNDWYRVHYYGYTCYVTADSFDMAFYHAPSNTITELVAPSDAHYGTWKSFEDPSTANVLTLKKAENGSITASLGLYRLGRWDLNCTKNGKQIEFQENHGVFKGQILFTQDSVFVYVENANEFGFAHVYEFCRKTES